MPTKPKYDEELEAILNCGYAGGPRIPSTYELTMDMLGEIGTEMRAQGYGLEVATDRVAGHMEEVAPHVYEVLGKAARIFGHNRNLLGGYMFRQELAKRIRPVDRSAGDHLGKAAASMDLVIRTLTARPLTQRRLRADMLKIRSVVGGEAEAAAWKAAKIARVMERDATRWGVPSTSDPEQDAEDAECDAEIAAMEARAAKAVARKRKINHPDAPLPARAGCQMSFDLAMAGAGT